jgi:uncharacterized protein with PIN domain
MGILKRGSGGSGGGPLWSESTDAIVRLDDDEVGKCEKCNRQLMEIDHYGERLIGCIDCKRWSWEGSKRLFMELAEEGLQALRDRVTPR